MKGLFHIPFEFPTYYQMTNQIFNPSMTNLNNQELISLLRGHREMISKLLENQNILKARFDALQRAQTADSEYSLHENNFQIGFILTNRPQTLCKTVQTILLKQEHRQIIKENEALKKRIQIISNCPIYQKVSGEELQQKEQKKQLQKNLEQNKKCCETKNIIKNYGKSILMFLRRNKPLVKKILNIHGYDEGEFYTEYEKFRDRVNSITELKLFWMEVGNRFARVYRIISNIYLKRYSLKHTFSSRVKNYGIHIKYRKRLMDVLKNPNDFSSIKFL